MKLDAGNNTNDVLSVGGNLDYGGTLTVTTNSSLGTLGRRPELQAVQRRHLRREFH